MTEPSSIRFSVFELDLEAGELCRNGAKVRLQEQPFQILVSLLERPGKVVTRDELRKKLWPADTFVDFDHGLNAAIRRLREALDDSAETPRFVETVARRGYRFIAPVDVASASAVEPGEQVPPATPALTSSATAAPSAAPTSQTASSAVLAVAKQHKLGLAAGTFAVLIVLGAAGFSLYSLLHRPARTPFQKFAMMQVTNTGKAPRAAISPDARYVLSVMDDNGLESLWLRDVPTGSDTQVIPPSASHYESLAFSPDGNYIYFRKAQNESNTAYNLCRSPMLGGTQQTVVWNIDSDITFSPDGQRIAYVRRDDPEAGKYSIFTASFDGTSETVSQVGAISEAPSSLAWSPRGDEIAYSLTPEQGLGAIEILNVGTGKSHRFVTLKDKFLNEIRWSPDGRGLFVMYFQAPWDVWGHWGIGFLRSAGGDLEPITQGTGRHPTLTLSADGRTFATVTARSYSTVSVLSKAGREFEKPRPLLSQRDEQDETSELSWSADGNLLVNNTVRLLKLAADGKNQTQLLFDSSAFIFGPSSCGPNYLVLIWEYHGGTNSDSIWRTNADGSGPLKLTDGNDWRPVCSPDQKWVYSFDAAGTRIYRAPLDGSGKKEAIFSLPQGYSPEGLSPDRKTLAATARQGRRERAIKVALFEIGSKNPPRMLDASNYYYSDYSNLSVQFTPDGKSVAYVIRENGVDNVWVLPLDGSAGHRITDFKSEHIWSFRLSPDGKSLAILRGHWDSDVVLLQESK